MVRPRRRAPKSKGPKLHLALDLGFAKALRLRAELAAKGLCDPDAPISLGLSSRLEDYPEDEIPKQ